jgi:2-isopropylmalate synthase
MERPEMKKLYIGDYSLAKLAKEKGRNLLFREKTAIAEMLDGVLADAIELPAVTSPREDNIVYRTIAAGVENSRLCIPVGFSTESVRQAWECVKDAKNPGLMVCVPLSTVQMEYTHHVKAPKMLSKIEELVKASAELCDYVEFVCGDATRAEAPFLFEAISLAEKSGAKAVTIVDELGHMLPEEFANFIKDIKNQTGLPVYVQTSDAIDLATACAIAAVSAGADGAKTAVAGSDVLRTEDLCYALAAVGETIGASTGLKTTQLHRDVEELIKKLSGEVYVTGQSAAGKVSDIMLDASCTLPQLSEAAVSLGYELSDEDCGKVYDALMQLCESKDYVGGKELEAMIASYAMQVPSTYHLESYVINSSNVTASMASIVLYKDDEKITGLASGNGPIDAAFKAIEQAVGYSYELDDFQINAVTSGKESLGSTLVRLRSGGRLYSGNGLSTDIVGASIRAYINALNKIIYEESR